MHPAQRISFLVDLGSIHTCALLRDCDSFLWCYGHLHQASASTLRQLCNDTSDSVLITGRNEVVAKVIFLQVSVCPQGGRVSASVHAGMPYPLRMESPPWMEEPPPDGEPPREADSSIRSTSGRYASYWNAFLLKSMETLENGLQPQFWSVITELLQRWHWRLV